MEPLGHGAIRSLHLGDLREHIALAVRLARAGAAAPLRLQLPDTLLHRSPFLGRESFRLLAWRGSARGALLGVALWAHVNLLGLCLDPTAIMVRHHHGVCQSLYSSSESAKLERWRKRLQRASRRRRWPSSPASSPSASGGPPTRAPLRRWPRLASPRRCSPCSPCSAPGTGRFNSS